MSRLINKQIKVLEQVNIVWAQTCSCQGRSIFLSGPSRDENADFDQIFPVRTKVTEQMHVAMHGGVRTHHT